MLQLPYQPPNTGYLVFNLNSYVPCSEGLPEAQHYSLLHTSAKKGRLASFPSMVLSERPPDESSPSAALLPCRPPNKALEGKSSNTSRRTRTYCPLGTLSGALNKKSSLNCREVMERQGATAVGTEVEEGKVGHHHS